MRLLWIAPFCLTLAACGGSSSPVVEDPIVPDLPAAPTDPDPVDPPTGDAQTGAEMRSSATSLLLEFADPVVFTELSNVPSSMTATYDGYAYGTLAGNPSTITDTLTGSLSMSIGLASNTANISGTISNFVDDADNAVTGDLTITDGTFNRAGDPSDDPTLSINFAGTLTDAGQDLVVGGQLQGDFLDTNYNGVGGALLGQVNGHPINGGFIAER